MSWTLARLAREKRRDSSAGFPGHAVSTARNATKRSESRTGQAGVFTLGRELHKNYLAVGSIDPKVLSCLRPD